MISAEITGTTAGTFNSKESIFIENKGISISCGSSNLNVESCLFLRCSKDAGSSIYLVGSNNKGNISKTCGRSCFLSAAGNSGIFSWMYGDQFYELVSFYDHSSNTNSRDLINFETGNHFVESLNVSHVNAYVRGFAWVSPKTGNNMVFSFGIAHNITNYCDIIYIYQATKAYFSYLSIVSCNSLDTSSTSFSHYVGKYFFVTEVEVVLNKCIMKNNKFVNLFYGTPKCTHCDIEMSSVSSFSTSFFDMNPMHAMYLQTFLCKASGVPKCVRTMRVYANYHVHSYFFLILVSTY